MLTKSICHHYYTVIVRTKQVSHVELLEQNLYYIMNTSCSRYLLNSFGQLAK